MADRRIGIIGFDTSHVPAFTKLLNDDSDRFHVAGGRVVAGYPSFSPDIEASASRVEGYRKQLSEEMGVKIVSSIEELLPEVDAVLLESNDGRRHLPEARSVIEAKKPLFIDKPLAANFAEAKEIVELAAKYSCPVFSSSSLRFDHNIQGSRNDPGLGKVIGCDAFSPATQEATNPGLFWYGIHGVEMLYTFMGTGCKKLFAEKTPDTDFLIGEWEDGRIGTVRGTRTGLHTFGVRVFGEKKIAQITYSTEVPIYAQLLKEIIPFFKTGIPPVPPKETLEIMQFMQAAILSEKEKRIAGLSEIG